MRELSIYFCSKCGRYAYYQLVRNAVCPNCKTSLTRLDMHYRDFMNLNHEERDYLIIRRLLDKHESLTGRLIAADRAHNYRATIGQLTDRIQELETENQKLNDTINWMHQTIWDLLNKTKSLERQLSDKSQNQHSSG